MYTLSKYKISGSIAVKSAGSKVWACSFDIMYYSTLFIINNTQICIYL